MRADLTASLGYRFIWRSWQFNLTLKPRLHDTTCCQTGCQLSYRLYNRFDNGLYRVNKHPTGCQTGLTTRLTTGWMFVYTIQPVVKPVVQPL